MSGSPDHIRAILALAEKLAEVQAGKTADDDACKQLMNYFIGRGRESGQPRQDVCLAMIAATYRLAEGQPEEVRAVIAQQAYLIADELGVPTPKQEPYRHDA